MEVAQWLMRKPVVLQAVGKGHSSFYNDIAAGLFTKPVQVGAKSVAWPSLEVAALIRARIAGKTPDEIRELVNDLHAKRKECVA